MPSEKSAQNTCRDESKEERRDSNRVAPGESKVLILTATGSTPATIVDESFGGICILVDSDDDFYEGQQVELRYGGIPLRAVARWVRQAADGQLQIGVEWLNERRQRRRDRRSLIQPGRPRNIKEERRKRPTDRRRATDSQQVTEAKPTLRLISIGGVPVICGLVQEHKDGRVTVQLPGGSEYKVPLEDLRSSSMLERRTQLENLDQELSIVVGVYRLGNPQTKDEAIEAVLDFEFAERVA